MKYKHRNCIIESTPTELHPQMVTVTKTPKIRESFLDRRYVTWEKAFLQIEAFESDRLINKKEKYVRGELQDIVILD